MKVTVMIAAGMLGILGPVPEAGPFDYEAVEIAPDVVGFFETRLNPIVSSNIVAVIGRDAVLLYDTGHHPTITRQIVADIKRRTSKPVKYVVISHWHDDHWAGNAEVARAFPDAQFIAHDFTSKLMESRREKFRGDSCRTDLEQSAQPIRGMLASGKRPDGTALTDSTRRRLQNFAEALVAQAPECDVMAYRGIDRTIATSLDIDLGGRRVRLEFLGRANTAGDIVAYLPESRTLLTGDLVVFPFPFATEPYVSEWVKVMRRLEGMNAATVVPGHGPLMHDAAYMRNVGDVLESIERQARAAYKPGMTADDLRRQIDLSAFDERFAHGDRFLQANFDAQMKGRAVERMWQELSGKWQPEGS